MHAIAMYGSFLWLNVIHDYNSIVHDDSLYMWHMQSI